MKRAWIVGGAGVVVLAVLLSALPSDRVPSGAATTAAKRSSADGERRWNLEKRGSVSRAAQQHMRRATNGSATERRPGAVKTSGRGGARFGQIAFSSNRTGTAQIWVMDDDGSDQTRLTKSAPMEDMQPAWSPDGSKLAFSRSVPAWYESTNLVRSAIWVIDADGSNEREIASAPGTINTRPQWSPDGEQILFVRGGAVQVPYNVWIMDADGSNQRPLTTDGFSTYPAWSPDGTKIVYLSGTQIFVMNADGTGARQITEDGPNYVPNWAPGKRIVFTSERDGGGKQIYVMDPDGSNETRLTFTGGEDKIPAWSPDGKRIAFARGPRECGSEAGAVACQVNNGYEIHTMNGDGSDVRRLTFTEVPERQFGENYPAWRPYGSAAVRTSMALTTLIDCTETFVTLQSGLSLTTIACGRMILTLAGHGRDAQPGAWNDNDGGDAFQRQVENGHNDIVWALTNNESLARRLKARGIPIVRTSDLTFAGCTAAGCTGQRVSASWRTPEGVSRFTLSSMQPQGGVPTPSHRHDYVWWFSDKWLWVEHGEAQEHGGPTEFTGSGYAAEQAGGERVHGFGFVQRGMTTVLHVASG